MSNTKIVRGWRKAVVQRRIDKLVAEGYVLVGPILSVDIGRRYMATMALPAALPIEPVTVPN